jgi:hypothetical protein
MRDAPPSRQRAGSLRGRPVPGVIRSRFLPAPPPPFSTQEVPWQDACAKCGNELAPRDRPFHRVPRTTFPSFPRAAWECRPRRSASSSIRPQPKRTRSHAPRGNAVRDAPRRLRFAGSLQPGSQPANSIPRSAWECRPRRSASGARGEVLDVSAIRTEQKIQRNSLLGKHLTRSAETNSRESAGVERGPDFRATHAPGVWRRPGESPSMVPSPSPGPPAPSHPHRTPWSPP